jgi:uncharacterized membrane protein
MALRPLFHVLPLWVLASLSLGHSGSGGGGGGGCGGGSSDDHHSQDDSEHRRASGAVCPSSEAPTAQDFGHAFLKAHCLSCHSASATGATRRGAPAGMNFDTPEEVRQWAAAIDAHSAAGPASVNTQMPPSSHSPPSLDDRVKLGLWLACGAP